MRSLMIDPSRRLDIAVVEIVALLLFGWAMYQEWKQSRRAAQLLAVAGVYGLILEILNMHVFRTYHYHSGFISVLGAPLVIGPLWGLVLISSMRLSDGLGVVRWARPLSDGALCVLVDLGMDAVAIRLKYWTWNIPLHEGFYGVPASNLFAWICVGLCFSVCARLAWRRGGILALLLVAPCAYVLLFVLFIANGIFQAIAGLQTEAEKLPVFWVTLFVCVVCMSLFRSVRLVEGGPVIGIYGVSRAAVHGYFLSAYVGLGLYREIPSLLVIAIIAGALEIVLHVRARQLPGRACRSARVDTVLDTQFSG
jgi:Carotenoid biosynthesis protein